MRTLRELADYVCEHHELMTKRESKAKKSFTYFDVCETNLSYCKTGAYLAFFFAGRFLSSRDRERARVFFGATFATRWEG